MLSEIKELFSGLLKSKYRASPINYHCYFSISIKLSSILLKKISIRYHRYFLARNIGTKLPILCDGQGQTTLGGLILRTKCGMQGTFHQPPLLMRVALKGSHLVPVAHGKWCYRSHSSVAVTQVTPLAITNTNVVFNRQEKSRKWSYEQIISTKCIEKRIGMVDTFDKKHLYRYLQYYLKYR